MNLRDQVRDGNRTLRVCHVLTRVSQCMAQMPGPLSKLNLGPTKVSCWILAGIFIEICVVYMYILLISIHMQVRKKINMIHMMHPHVHHYMDM